MTNNSDRAGEEAADPFDGSVLVELCFEEPFRRFVVGTDQEGWLRHVIQPREMPLYRGKEADTSEVIRRWHFSALGS